MSTHQNADGSFQTSADVSRSFEHEYQAQLHEEDLNRRSQQPLPQVQPTYSASDPGLFDVLVACKPFYSPLILYWLIAFPAINACWLLRTAGFPFSWIGNILYYPWTFLVKAAGAPYYLAFLFGEAGAAFAMPVIAVIWWFVLAVILGNIREKRPQLYKNVFIALGIAAAIPVALTLIAFMVGSLRSDVVQVFWYGHDPYTYPVWEFLNRQTLHFVYPGIER